ncbi:MAG: ATP-binding protein, partial [Spirulina sp.]
TNRDRDIAITRDKLLNLHQNLPQTSHLDKLCQTFHLSSFERDILLLCLGIELNSEFERLCGELQNNPKKSYPTFSLTLALFQDTHLEALTPVSPLRYWQLINVEPGMIFTQSPLRIDEWIFHYLLGSSFLDERLERFLEPVSPVNALVKSHQQLVEQLLHIWQEEEFPNIPVVQLCGQNLGQLRAIAAAVCEKERQNLYAIASHLLPIEGLEAAKFLRLWERESQLQDSVLLLEIDDIRGEDVIRNQTISLFIDRIQTPLIIATRDRLSPRRRSLLTFEVQTATLEEQRENWHAVLSHLEESDRDPIVKTLTAQFNLNLNVIESVGAIAKGNLTRNCRANSLSYYSISRFGICKQECARIGN